MPVYGGLYPKQETWKYPKAGEKNSVVDVYVFNTKSFNLVKCLLGSENDQYLPRIKWTKDPNQLCIFRMNRHQNELELLLADAKSGKTSLLLKETNSIGFFYCFASAENGNFDCLYLCNGCMYRHETCTI